MACHTTNDFVRRIQREGLNQVITFASAAHESAYKAAKQTVNFAQSGLRAVTGESEGGGSS
jgi:hypothetical protein